MIDEEFIGGFVVGTTIMIIIWCVLGLFVFTTEREEYSTYLRVCKRMCGDNNFVQLSTNTDYCICKNKIYKKKINDLYQQEK